MTQLNIYALALTFMALSTANAQDLMQTPKAEEIPHKLKKHGDVRVDPYFWLKERTNPKVIDYLKAENAYLENVMKPTEELQKKLFSEMKGRIKEDDSTVPAKDGEYFYYVRYEKGKEYPIYCRKHQSLENKEQVILDVNELAKGQPFTGVYSVQPSPDHKMIAYGVDHVGRRIYTIQFKNLETGKNLPDQIKEVTGDLAWAKDNQTIFYTKQHPETLRSEKVFRHKLGDPKDLLVYFEKDEIYSLDIRRSLTDNYIFITSESTLSTEVRYLSANEPTGEFKVFLPREKEHEYEIEDAGDRFFVRTNWKAKNFRIMEATLGKTNKANWKQIIAHRKDVLVDDFLVLKGHLVLQERKDGLTQINLVNRKSLKGTRIQFADPVYLAGIHDNREYDSPFLRFSYESMTTPDSIFDYELQSGKQILRKQQEVPGGFKKENYDSQRLFAKAKDGVKIPISILYRKGTKPSPNTPLLIYGYGSYGFSMDPWFNTNILSLVDRGFIYAIAHIRGGSEMGRHWYEDGRQLKKKNTFTDFIACTEHLIKQGFSSPAHTYAEGGSAGGLLMGAVMNMRPDLYHGMIAAVPFVDVVTTMLDASIPLTTGEYDEWGNPNKKTYYRYIKSYSPYDNVAPKEYPNLLVTTGLHDSQVQYWEPAKWVAKLRKLKKDNNLLLFRTEMEAGHGGKSGRFERLKLKALEYAFFLKLEKIEE